ncbi:MAG: hypothetical protein ACPGQS_10270, partial [Bradymonadia bacterium]
DNTDTDRQEETDSSTDTDREDVSPEEEEEEVIIEDTVGEPCVSNADCVSDGETCLLQIDGSQPQSLPGGYCTKTDCLTVRSCPQGSSCSSIERLNSDVCLADCSFDSDCRNGYECINNTCWVSEPEVQFDPNRPTIRGRLSYDYYRTGSSGGHGSLRRDSSQPAGGLIGLIYDVNDQLITTTFVQNDGHYEVQLENPLTGGEQIYFIPALYVEASNYMPLIIANPAEGSSFNNGVRGTIWSWAAQVPSNGQVQDLNITREQGSGAVFAFQVVAETMMTFANEQFGGDLTQMPTLAIWWRPDQAWSCGACYHNVSLQIGLREYSSSIFMTGNNLGGAWSAPVLLHEFGHYISARFSRDDNPGGPHTLGQPTSPAQAMSEGFASFNALRQLSRRASNPVSQMRFVQDNITYTIDYGVSRSANNGTIAFPNPNGRSSDDLDEQVVTVALWHLFDGSEVSEDRVNDGAAFSFTDLLGYMQSPRYLERDRAADGADLIDFFDAIYCSQNARWGDALGIAENIIGLPYNTPTRCQ